MFKNIIVPRYLIHIYHIRTWCIRRRIPDTRALTSSLIRLVCVCSNVTGKHKQRNIYAFWSDLHRIQYFISLVYITRMYSTKTLTHDFAFLAHVFTNCVTFDHIYSTKFWIQQLKTPPLNVLLFPAGSSSSSDVFWRFALLPPADLECGVNIDLIKGRKYIYIRA